MSSGNKFARIGVGAIVLAVLVLTVMYLRSPASSKVANDLLCPSQYTTAETAAAGFQEFSDQFYTTHPDARMSDMLHSRIDFYISHHCTLELQRYQQAMDGKADPTTMKIINTAIQRAI